MDTNQEVLAVLSNTSSMTKMTNFNTDNGLKGTFNPVANDSYLCSEASKENDSVTFANLFQFNHHGVAIADMDETSIFDSIDCDQVPCYTTSSFEERSVSFAPSCQVIHMNIEDNQAHVCHEPVKKSSPHGFCNNEIDHTPGMKKRKTAPGSNDKVPICYTNKKRVVSFASSCPEVYHVDNYTEGYEHEIWYSRHDFMLFEDEACLCSQLIQDIESHGAFDGDIGHLLGLEKIILCESYLDKRDALRQTVLTEQAVQQLVKHIRWSQGYGSDDESDPADISLVHLAKTSERLSLWARERATMAALTLEHDLKSCKA